MAAGRIKLEASKILAARRAPFNPLIVTPLQNRCRSSRAVGVEFVNPGLAPQPVHSIERRRASAREAQGPFAWVMLGFDAGAGSSRILRFRGRPSWASEVFLQVLIPSKQPDGPELGSQLASPPLLFRSGRRPYLL